MKKLLILCSFLLIGRVVSAQVIPSFAFGAKAGVNLSQFSTTGTLSSSNRAGFLGGFYARFGALGFNFQPELYYTSKNVTYDYQGVKTQANFRSIDLPLLFGAKVGAFGVGGRFYTGPVASFAIDKDHSFSEAAGQAFHLNTKGENFAWQVGAGLDLRNLSLDLRYEAGLSKMTFPNNSQSRINLFNLSLGYKLF